MSKRPWVLPLVAALAVVGTVAFILYPARGVRLLIYNADPDTIRMIVVHVTGNSYPLGELLAGGKGSIRAVAKGDSHVEVEFTDSAGKRKTLPADCHFGAGYRGYILIELNAHKILKVEAKVGPGFF